MALLCRMGPWSMRCSPSSTSLSLRVATRSAGRVSHLATTRGNLQIICATWRSLTLSSLRARPSLQPRAHLRPLPPQALLPLQALLPTLHVRHLLDSRLRAPGITPLTQGAPPSAAPTAISTPASALRSSHRSVVAKHLFAGAHVSLPLFAVGIACTALV